MGFRWYDMLRKLKGKTLNVGAILRYIYIGQHERIGELGYIVITLDGPGLSYRNLFLENLTYFSCELVICFAGSRTLIVGITQMSIVQTSSNDWSHLRRKPACFVLRLKTNCYPTNNQTQMRIDFFSLMRAVLVRHLSKSCFLAPFCGCRDCRFPTHAFEYKQIQRYIYSQD